MHERPPLGDIPYKLILLDDLNVRHKRKTLQESEYKFIKKIMPITKLMTNRGISNKLHITQSVGTNITQNNKQVHHHKKYLQQQYKLTQGKFNKQ